jgi:aminopeptidase YwaD
VAINVDDVGYKEGKSAYSFHSCPPDIQEGAEAVFGDLNGVIPGELWFNGDHMVFVQKGVPAIAFTAEMMPGLMATVTHTPQDTPELIEPAKLVEVARALNRFIAQF